MPLFLNPLLPHLAFLIASKAFRDYDTLEQLLDAKPRLGDNPWQRLYQWYQPPDSTTVHLI